MKRNVVSLGKIAHKLKREGRLQEAEETYIQMLRIDSDNVYALVGLGDLKRGARRFEEAADYYRRCLEIEKNNWYALAGLGDAYRGLGDLDKAMEMLSMLRQRELEDRRISEDSRRFLERYPEIGQSIPVYAN